jgi:hypothetical protein
MKRIIIGIFLLAVTSFMVNCEAGRSSSTSSSAGGDDSPTEAYKKLYAAVKAKDPDAIRAVMTKGSIEFAKADAARTNQTLEKKIENGFTATTFSPTLPEIRDERIQGDMGAVEVYNSRDKRWEDLPFIREDGSWKLAIGEMWFGKYKSPGKGQSLKEQEAANAMSNNIVPLNSNGNGNFKGVHPIVPKPASNLK